MKSWYLCADAADVTCYDGILFHVFFEIHIQLEGLAL
jgi:hypothetical protein